MGKEQESQVNLILLHSFAGADLLHVFNSLVNCAIAPKVGGLLPFSQWSSALLPLTLLGSLRIYSTLFD